MAIKLSTLFASFGRTFNFVGKWFQDQSTLCLFTYHRMIHSSIDPLIYIYIYIYSIYILIVMPFARRSCQSHVSYISTKQHQQQPGGGAGDYSWAATAEQPDRSKIIQPRACCETHCAPEARNWTDFTIHIPCSALAMRIRYGFLSFTQNVKKPMRLALLQ